MMNFSVCYTKDAQEELREIALYIQSYDPVKAEPFVNSIIDYFDEILTDHPKSGKAYIKNIRKLTYKKYTAFYRFNKHRKEVEIMHVVDLAKPLEIRRIEL